MADSTAGRNPFDVIAEEFAERFRQGERPSISEYVEKHPDLAERIHRLFPALVVMEDLASGVETGLGEIGRAGGLKVPERLGDYRILREVGRGGMGIVYEAEQESLGRHVALKVLPNHALLDARNLQRFHREARAAARLHHTNIVPVFGVGEHEGMPYYVMQFIQGLGLDEVLVELKHYRRAPPTPLDVGPGGTACAEAGAPLSAAAMARTLLAGGSDANASKSVGKTSGTAFGSRSVHLPGQAGDSTLSDSGREYWWSVARIGVQVAEALAYAHAQGVLHRDIKPSNLLLDTHGTVWITDFGLAKAEVDADLTGTGEMLGTWRYMAPERFQGLADARSDVYALGITLYELLALRPAFPESDRNQLVQRVVHDEPPRPRKLNAAIPRDLETIVLKAIAREPALRYATAGDLSADLRRFLEDKPIQARRTSVWLRTAKWVRRRPMIAALVAAVFLVTALGAAGVLWQWRKASQARDDAITLAGKEKQAHHAEAQAKQQLQLQFAKVHEANAGRLLADRDLRSANLFLEAARVHTDAYAGTPPADDPWLQWNQWRIGAILRSCPKPVFAHQLTRVDLNVDRVATSQDGRLLYLHDRNGSHVFDVRTNQKIISLNREAVGGWYPRPFSPDGRRMVTYDGKAVRVHDVQTGKQVATIQHAAANFVAFVADGRRVITSSGTDGLIRLWDGTTGEAVAEMSAAPSIRTMVLSRAADRLAVSTPHPTWDGSIVTPALVQVFDTLQGQLLFTKRHSSGIAYLSFSHDGQRLLGADYDFLYVWDLPSGAELAKVPHTNPVRAALTADGQALISTGADGRVRIRDLVTEKDLVQPLEHSNWVNMVHLSPDGRWVATASNDTTARVWDVRTGEPVTPLLQHCDNVLLAQFSADGRFVVTVTRAGIVRAWDLTTLPATRGFFGHRGAVRTAKFSPDGRRLLTAGDDGTARLWDVATRAALGPPLKHAGPVRRASFSSDGRMIVTDSEDRSARLWDAETGRPIIAPVGSHLGKYHSDPAPGVSRAVLSPDGRLLVLTYVNRFNVFDWRAGKDIVSNQTLAESARSHIDGAHFSPNGRYVLLFSSGNSAELWDLEACKELTRVQLPDQGVVQAIFDPQGQRVIVALRDGDLRLLDFASGQQLQTLRLGAMPSQIVYHPKRDWLAVSNVHSPAVRVWDLNAGKPLTPLLLHGGKVTHMAFSSDGELLVTASADRTARVWDARTSQPLMLPLRHESAVTWAEFHPDSLHLVTATQDGKVRWWPLPGAESGSWDQLACRSRIVTSHHFDAIAGMTLLRPDQCLKDWSKARQEYPADFAAGAGAPVASWHERQQEAAAGEQQWSAAIFHLDRLIAAQPDRAEWRARRGRAHGMAGKWPEALADFSKATELTPRDAACWHDLGRARLRLGRIAEAVADYDRALQLEPESAPLWLRKSIAHEQLGQKPEGEEAYAQAAASSKVILMQPDRPWSQRETRAGWKDHALWEEIAVDCSRLINDDFGKSWTWRARALAQAALGEWKTAAADFAKAAELNPQDRHAWRGAARAHAELNEWAAVADACTKATELKADGWDVRYLRARAHGEQKRWKEALAGCTAALELGPNHAETWYLRGLARLQLREFGASAEDLARAAELAPDNASIHYLFGVAQAELGRWNGAATAFEKALETSAATISIQYQYALACLGARRTEDYRKTCLKLTRLNTVTDAATSPEVLNTVAWLCALAPQATSDIEPCVRLAEKAVARDPKSHAFRNTLGAILYRAEKYDEAVKQLNQAIQLHGEGGTAVDWLFLAMAHHRLGQVNESRRWLDKTEQLKDQALPAKPGAAGPGRPASWTERLELEILRREATALSNADGDRHQLR